MYTGTQPSPACVHTHVHGHTHPLPHTCAYMYTRAHTKGANSSQDRWGAWFSPCSLLEPPVTQTRGPGLGTVTCARPPVGPQPGRKHRPGLRRCLQSVHRARPNTSHFRRLPPNKTAVRKWRLIPHQVSGPRWRRRLEPTRPRNGRSDDGARPCSRLARATCAGERAWLWSEGRCPRPAKPK